MNETSTPRSAVALANFSFKSTWHLIRTLSSFAPASSWNSFSILSNFKFVIEISIDHIYTKSQWELEKEYLNSLKSGESGGTTD